MPEVTLYSLTMSEIESMLDNATKSPDDAFSELHAKLSSMNDDEDKFHLLSQDRKFLRAVYEAAKFKRFAFQKMEADVGFQWSLKLKFDEVMPKLHHGYRLHFCHNPLPYFQRIDDLEQKIDLIRQNPSLIPEEDEDKVAKIRQDIDVQDGRFEDEKSVCQDIDVFVTVKEVKYGDGTAIVFSIPSTLAGTLNDRQNNIGCYKVRLQNV